MDARTFRSAPNPTADPAERIAVGKEEQRHERALTLKKVGASDIELDPTCRVLTEKMQEQSLVSQGFAGF